MLLVYEINNLRRELKFARDRILSYEIALGVTASSQASKQAEMRVKLQNAIVEREEIEIGHNKTLEVSLKINFHKIHGFIKESVIQVYN